MEKSGKALLVGATGLIGSYCLQALLKDHTFTEVEAWVRKPLGIVHSKLKIVLIDFPDISRIPATDASYIFCCLGTTIRNAGSQEAFRRVDYEYVVEMARLAHRSQVEKFLVVSSLGANAESSNFYLRTKGEMEESVINCGIPSVVILRPSMLLGRRNEFRPGEVIGKAVMQTFNFMFIGKMKKYRAIKAPDVAKAMVKLAKESNMSVLKIESDQIRELARN
jgi:uncharacterized protein YbjT (DUF2867 family)